MKQELLQTKQNVLLQLSGKIPMLSGVGQVSVIFASHKLCCTILKKLKNLLVPGKYLKFCWHLRC